MLRLTLLSYQVRIMWYYQVLITQHENQNRIEESPLNSSQILTQRKRLFRVKNRKTSIILFNNLKNLSKNLSLLTHDFFHFIVYFSPSLSIQIFFSWKKIIYPFTEHSSSLFDFNDQTEVGDINKPLFYTKSLCS